MRVSLIVARWSPFPLPINLVLRPTKGERQQKLLLTIQEKKNRLSSRIIFVYLSLIKNKTNQIHKIPAT